MNSTDVGWIAAVPQETSFVVVTSDEATIQTVLQSEYMPFLEDISSSAVQLVAEIDSNASQSLPLKSILLNPGTNQKLQPVWITEGPEDFKEKLIEKYSQRFSQNEYQFHGVSILKLKLKNRNFFVAHLGPHLLLSESSMGIENSIRAYRGIGPAANLAELDLVPGSIVINTPALDRWVSQLGRVKFHPKIKDAFEGTSPGVFTMSTLQETGEEDNGEESDRRISGEIPLTEDSQSQLIQSVSYQNGAITLDDYISSNAAAFGIFHAPPAGFPESLPDTSSVDTYLNNNTGTYEEIRNTLESEFGLVMYAESGFLSAGESLYLRKLNSTANFRSQLDNLNERNLIEKSGEVYFVQSRALAQLLGSKICNFSSFYINIVDDAAAISKRKGLAELVASDKNRRRVISYEPFYKEITSTFPDQLSGLFIAGPQFNSFLSTFVATEQYLNALTSTFNYLALTTRVNEPGNRLSLNLFTYNRKQGQQPFQENWILDVGNAGLSGPPVFGNIGGSYSDEVVFATKTGTVYALATDGTVVRQYDTGRDEPIGSPVVYDWYGTDQNIILIAAGNKIYGWDENGELLPKFPLELNETITTPLTIADINNNRLPDAIVSTVDRKLHVLNGRGINSAGWPVTTNAPVRSIPWVGYYQGVSTVIAFSSNAVHAWDASGNTRPGFPKFINANFSGAPAKLNEMILGGAVNGNLYAIGDEISFADSLNVYNSGPSNSSIKGIYVSNSALSGTPAINENKILVTSSNGAVFLLNVDGELELTKNMGQPSAADWPARILDINNDGNDDIVALANYGRLYAWQIDGGERIFDLPKAGINHLNIGDLDGDGLMEVVGQTEEGVRSWTINR